MPLFVLQLPSAFAPTKAPAPAPTPSTRGQWRQAGCKVFARPLAQGLFQHRAGAAPGFMQSVRRPADQIARLAPIAMPISIVTEEGEACTVDDTQRLGAATRAPLVEFFDDPFTVLADQCFDIGQRGAARRADTQAAMIDGKPDRAAGATAQEVGNDTVAERDAAWLLARRNGDADERQRQLGVVAGVRQRLAALRHPGSDAGKTAHLGLDPGLGAGVDLSSCVRPAGSIAGPMLTTTCPPDVFDEGVTRPEFAGVMRYRHDGAPSASRSRRRRTIATVSPGATRVPLGENDDPETALESIGALRDDLIERLAACRTIDRDRLQRSKPPAEEGQLQQFLLEHETQ